MHPGNRAHKKRPLKVLTLSRHQHHREACQTILLASLGFDRAQRLVVLLLFVPFSHSVTICTPNSRSRSSSSKVQYLY